MAFVLSEEIVENLVKQINENNPAFQFDWKKYAVTTQTQGRRVVYGILVENEDYFALIQVNSFDVTSISKVSFIAKSEIQGVHIRKGVVNLVLKIRMFNGEYYKLIFNPKAGKKLPHHQENILYYQQLFLREFANRTDLKDRHSGFLLKAWNIFVWIAAFIATVVALLMTKSKLVAIIVFVVTAVGLEMLSEAVISMVNKSKDKAFVYEKAALDRNISAMTEKEHYHALLSMKEKPKTDMLKVGYYSEMIDQAHTLGYQEEAKSYLAKFPRRYSEEAEKKYQQLLNLLAASPKRNEEDQKVPSEIKAVEAVE